MVVVIVFFGVLLLFFGLLNTKSIKLGISPDDTNFKHIYGNITYTYRSTTHIIWSRKHTSGLPTRPTTKQWFFSKMEFGVYEGRDPIMVHTTPEHKKLGIYLYTHLQSQ